MHPCGDPESVKGLMDGTEEAWGQDKVATEMAPLCPEGASDYQSRNHP